MSNEYRDKLRSIGTPRGRTSKRTVVREERGTLITTEHSDGRVDATVRPDTVDYEARTHRTGKRKGQVAEIVRKGSRA